MTHRPASALSCACAVVLLLALGAPASAVLIDHFDHATDPAIAATRTLNTTTLTYPAPGGGFEENLTLLDSLSLIVYDGDSAHSAPAATIEYEADTSIDLTAGGNNRFELDFLAIDHTSAGPGSLDLVVTIVDTNGDFLLAPTTVAQSLTPVTVSLRFEDFIGPGGIDLTIIEFIDVALTGPGDGTGNLAAALDSISTAPTPSALAMGLIGIVALGARRRRRTA